MIIKRHEIFEVLRESTKELNCTVQHNNTVLHALLPEAELHKCTEKGLHRKQQAEDVWVELLLVDPLRSVF